MNELLEKLELPTVAESYLDYKIRMETIHGSDGDVPKAIKLKYYVR